MDLLDSSNDYSSYSKQEEAIMANNNRTLMELTVPDLNQQPLFITFPDFAENVTFELKFGLIHILPNFYGLPSEDPYKYI